MSSSKPLDKSRRMALKRGVAAAVVAAFVGFGGWLAYQSLRAPSPSPAPPPAAEKTPVAGNVTVKLPNPRLDSDLSVEETLRMRRSVRDYTGKPLTTQEVAQLLWAAQGITDPRGLRTAPSAGALYPLEVYVVVGDVENIPAGVYRYKPPEHELIKVAEGDRRVDLSSAAVGQEWVKNCAVSFVFTAVYERTTVKYGERGVRYVHMEAGHAAQNLCLQAVALQLGSVTVGAFYDDQVKEILSLPDGEQPLYIVPVGRK